MTLQLPGNAIKMVSAQGMADTLKSSGLDDDTIRSIVNKTFYPSVQLPLITSETVKDVVPPPKNMLKATKIAGDMPGQVIIGTAKEVYSQLFGQIKPAEAEKGEDGPQKPTGCSCGPDAMCLCNGVVHDLHELNMLWDDHNIIDVYAVVDQFNTTKLPKSHNIPLSKMLAKCGPTGIVRVDAQVAVLDLNLFRGLPLMARIEQDMMKSLNEEREAYRLRTIRPKRTGWFVNMQVYGRDLFFNAYCYEVVPS